MYNGPPLPVSLALPFPLQVEFLIAVSSGKQSRIRRASEGIKIDDVKPWTLRDIDSTQVSSHEGLRQFINGNLTGEKFAIPLINLLSKGEKFEGRIVDSSRDAIQKWISTEEEDRKTLLKAAYQKYDLSEQGYAQRQKTFIAWGQELRRAGKVTIGDVTHFAEAVPKKTDYDESERQAQAPSELLQKQLLGTGFIDLRAGRKSSHGFQRFMTAEALPYFSRDDYAAEIGENRFSPSEKEILGKISEADQQYALLIAGPGGYGKTRLAHQICIESEADLVIQSTIHADYEALRVLLEERRDISQIILMIDYAETFGGIIPLKSFLEDIEERGVRATVLLCCRSSGIARVRLNFRDLNPIEYELGKPTQPSGSLNYEAWLVDRILGYFGLGERRELALMCRGMPFLAAFAGFLATEHPQKFSAQFVVSVHEPEFARWVTIRIEQLVDQLDGRRTEAKERLAQLALALPFDDGREVEIVKDQHGLGGALIEALISDCWAEWDSEGTRAIHDTLADAIVAHHLFSGGKATKRAKNLLANAAERSYFNQALGALGRLADHSSFNQIDNITLLESLEKTHAVTIQQHAVDILRSRLLPIEQVPLALEKIGSLFEGLEGDQAAGVHLSRIAAALTRGRHKDSGKSSIGLSRLDELLRSTALRGSNPRVFASLLAYRPDAFAEPALKLLFRIDRQRDASFLICSYLLEVGVNGQIGLVVQQWLSKYHLQIRAGFVFSAWLSALPRSNASQAAPDISTEKAHIQVMHHLEAWLEKNGLNIVAFRPLQELLLRFPNNRNHLVRAEAWLDAFGRQPIAVHLINQIIRNSDAASELLASFAAGWLSILDNVVRTTECSYLFANLRKRSYSFAQFKVKLLEAIKERTNVKSGRDLCVQWLLWGGAAAEVKAQLKELIAQDPTDEHVRFAFEGWFNSVRGPHLLAVEGPEQDPSASMEENAAFQDEMQEWLRSNARHPRASYIFNIWFALKLNPQPIVHYLYEWLMHNQEDIQYPIMLSKYSSWSGTGVSKIGVSEEKARQWLRLMSDGLVRAHNRYIESILRAEFATVNGAELRESAMRLAYQYLETFGDSEDAAFLISTVLLAENRPFWVTERAEKWLVSFWRLGRAGLVYQALLRSGYDKQALEPSIQQWLVEHIDYEHAGALVLAWLDAGGEKSILAQAVARWLVHAREKGHRDVEQVEFAYGL